MKTPICDFVKNYALKNTCRLHVPGHKGAGFLGVENYDVTEIDGADDLYSASGIIKESEDNASSLFNCPTFYTTEGSSHAIRAMIYLATLYAKKHNKSNLILSTRNVHKSFLTIASLLDVKVKFISSNTSSSYLTSELDCETLENYLKKLEVKPCALYVTSPDYLGNIIDIKALKSVCEKYGILLLVDNAHGAYLKFLSSSLFPIDLGADMCSSSAHKTLPVLTGGAYLHLSNEIFNQLKGEVKTSLSMFGTTSPSYLILQSLDYANFILSNNFNQNLQKTISLVSKLRDYLNSLGLKAKTNEPLKLTITPKSYGYLGKDFVLYLSKNQIIPEFYDNDYVVLTFSVNTPLSDFDKVSLAISKLEKKEEITSTPPIISSYNPVLSFKETLYSETELIDAKDSLNRIYADVNIHCPPAVPIIVIGEKITKDVIDAFKYYGINTVKVVKQ